MTQFKIINSATPFTIPDSVALSGTIEATGTRIRGTGTFFESEFMRKKSAGFDEPKYYLYCESLGEIRSIATIIDDEELYINTPFSSNFAGEATRAIPIEGSFKKVEINGNVSDDLNIGLLDEDMVTIEKPLGKGPITLDSGGNGIAAVYIGPTGLAIEVTINL